MMVEAGNMKATGLIIYVMTFAVFCFLAYHQVNYVSGQTVNLNGMYYG